VTLGENKTIAQNKIVPLFEHGEGIGGFGCVSIAQPVFFSEEEAFAILQSAFAQAGLALEKNSKLQKAVLPVTVIDTWDENWDNHKSARTSGGRLTPDGTLNGIPVEFVSREDVLAWEYKPRGPIFSGSSVGTYQLKEAAQTLADYNPGIVAFYDPVSYYNDWNSGEWAEYSASEEEARARSEGLLREQAQAFIAWMEGN